MHGLKRTATGVLAGSLLLASPAWGATTTEADLDGQVMTNMMDSAKSFDFNADSDTTSTNEDGSTTFEGSFSGNNWDFSWTSTARENPFIDSVLSFTNTTSSTQTFDVTLNVPADPSFNPAFKSGDLKITGEDTSGDGSLEVLGIDWDGEINGTEAFSLFTSDIDVTGSAGVTATVGPVSDGPLFHDEGGPINDIGVRMQFDLSAGDKVTFDSRFEVTPVPVPAALWLFGAGLAGLGAFARRRQR